MTKFERVKRWAEANGFDWRSTYGHYVKRIITHNSTLPAILEPEEMEHIYDIVEAEKTRMLEDFAELASMEYEWQEVDNWIFAFGTRARDELLRRRRNATKSNGDNTE